MADRERFDFWYGSRVLAYQEPTVVIGPRHADVWHIQCRFLWPAPAHFLMHQQVAQMSRSCPSGSHRSLAIQVISATVRSFLTFDRTSICNALHLGIWKVFVASCAPAVISLMPDCAHTEDEFACALNYALLVPVSRVLEYLGVRHAEEAWHPYTVTHFLDLN